VIGVTGATGVTGVTGVTGATGATGAFTSGSNITTGTINATGLITASAGITLPLTSGVYLTNNNWPNTVISPSIFSDPTLTLGSYDYSGYDLRYRFIFNNGQNDIVEINFGVYGSGVIHFKVSGVYSIAGNFGIKGLDPNITGLYNITSLGFPICVGSPCFMYTSFINAGDNFVVVNCYSTRNDSYNFASVIITRLY